MDRKTKKSLIITAVGVAFMFAWIFVTVALTDGKELSDFTPRDMKIFIGFMVIELLTIGLTLFAALRGKRLSKSDFVKAKPLPESKYEKREKRRGWILLIGAYLSAFIFTVSGAFFSRLFSEQAKDYMKIALAVFFVVPFICLGVSLILKKRYEKNFEQMQVAEWQRYLIEHRESAEKTAVEKKSLLKKIKAFTMAYAVILWCFAVGIGLFAGAAGNEAVGFFGLLSGFIFLTSYSRIQFTANEFVFDDDERYVEKEEFPELYSLVQRAADRLNCSGEIKVCITNDCNAGIAQVGHIFSVQLGAVLLNYLSEDEIYSILLHEFCHIASESSVKPKDFAYAQFVEAGGNQMFGSPLVSRFFSYFDSVYSFNFAIYLYSVSIKNETEADRAMLLCGDRKIAGSALLKIKYHDLFEWEDWGAETGCVYEPEKLEKGFLYKEIERLKNETKARADDWNELTKAEILSRGASHPTTEMRLDALGATELCTVGYEKSEALQKECEKAVDFTEEFIIRYIKEDYDEQREEFYLKPKKKIEEWKAAGEPLVAEEYADIVGALRQLVRFKEAEELCDRAIAELPEAAANFAYFSKGCFLLHRYDADGIALVYRALENNSNYIDEGMNIIGAFCCLTGRQDELDEYREKSPVIFQKQKDEYDQLSVLTKKDELSSEQLPDGLLEEIISYITSIDGGSVQKIYLVRKTISEKFFTSAFIIEVSDGADEEIWDKIFSYLDTCSDWQFSLFDYNDVADVKPENIEGSLVYSKE